MDVIARAAPPPGSAEAGDLYVDLQTRTLWLGVDPAVDPAQFVLVSDMLALQAEIAGAIAECKAYTDAGMATRAPIDHTHTASQITDFTEAVSSVVVAMPGVNWVAGMIIKWKGALSEIGVGQLAGWALCDGNNGTPDLRDKFVLGAGNKLPGSLNPLATITTTDGGSHIHGIYHTALTLAQMPPHNHEPGTGGENVDHAHHFSANTGGMSAQHNHQVPQGTGGGGSGGSDTDGHAPTSFHVTSTPASADHYHGVSGWSSGRNAGHVHAIHWAGSGHGHGHDMAGGAGVHNHNLSSGQIRDATPWYALAFIMKL
jgi:hypothetical protein